MLRIDIECVFSHFLENKEIRAPVDRASWLIVASSCLQWDRRVSSSSVMSHTKQVNVAEKNVCVQYLCKYVQ
jgi:hypothetical protein